jgi:23S rRNA pseudouridine955/2504/2580 synthase
VRFEAGENEAGRRLDRVLKKFLRNAPLSFIYRIIRKDVKLNGKRASGETLLSAGDVVEIFLPDGQLKGFLQKRPADACGAKKEFEVVYEDEQLLVVDKPFGLLVHGDKAEKKNTLTNQVVSYLAEMGIYVPGEAAAFTPAPANRLDRNTTGIVLFGKTLAATRDLALMLKGREEGNANVEKAYLTIVKGRLKEPMTLRSRMTRDEDRNVTNVLPEGSPEGRVMATEVIPLKAGKEYTLVEARLMTGRTHQIRVQLADAGFPVIGDRKYGERAVNAAVSGRYGLTSQLLHAYRLTVLSGAGILEYLKGKCFFVNPPERFKEIAEDLGCDMKMK